MGFVPAAVDGFGEEVGDFAVDDNGVFLALGKFGVDGGEDAEGVDAAGEGEFGDGEVGGRFPFFGHGDEGLGAVAEAGGGGGGGGLEGGEEIGEEFLVGSGERPLPERSGGFSLSAESRRARANAGC